MVLPVGSDVGVGSVVGSDVTSVVGSDVAPEVGSDVTVLAVPLVPGVRVGLAGFLLEVIATTTTMTTISKISSIAAMMPIGDERLFLLRYPPRDDDEYLLGYLLLFRPFTFVCLLLYKLL